MSAARHRLDAIRALPSDDWTFEDVAGVCESFGLICRAPRKGTHFAVSHPALDGILTGPATRAIKPLYVALLIDMIDAVVADEGR